MPQAQKTRRQMLEEFVAAKPNDPFSRYGLALECMNAGDSPAAEQHFQNLIAKHPEYIATYYQFAQFLIRNARSTEARQVLTSGIAVAQKKGDDHARSEMETTLAELH
ncbi:MAG TPA: tetratricopeptide repeat protein [Candidatus Dormibacteraeota bacterium]|nr:tetratricopeptide repeat protein [Candidatus Dormibacteraeota bacterium]